MAAAVILPPKLRLPGLNDSKQMSDESCLRLGAALRGSLPHAIAAVVALLLFAQQLSLFGKLRRAPSQPAAAT